MQGIADKLGGIDLQPFGIGLGEFLEHCDRLLHRHLLGTEAGQRASRQRPARSGQGRQGVGHGGDIGGAVGRFGLAHFQQARAGHEGPPLALRQSRRRDRAAQHGQRNEKPAQDPVPHHRTAIP